ncbi:unnamed protein product [Rotaria sp. Silwood2]|nr:unnamed protein product [Rotaria sp. Silwood2]CAF2685836.1 unnamed protein product [Rotaria sp. Silwood2]CAF3094014.1 unnamed protein product [Rotaria sp. Silwood2]CAF3204497.1 unnamed protein product [Rotaria sp. Silwood2]CAF4051733.1 unnamed protein product [Rotaria sp. Silwood2]
MIWSIDQGINVVSDNRKSLSRNGQINYVTMNIIYHQIDSKTFAFQIDGNADARYDYQIFSLAKYTKSGMTQTTREKRQPNQCNPPGNHAIYVVGTLVINTILQEIYQRLIQNPNQIRRIRPNDPNNPIQESIVRQLPRGLFAHTERVEFVIARITPRHYNPNNRVDFPSSGSTSTQYMRTNLNALAGDERGHIVASVFGGPPVAYNMFPQHRSLNRNYRASHILVDWFEAEARIRQHLGNNRGDVQWEVALSYDDLNTGRPTSVSFSATFYDRNGAVVDRLEGTLRNCEGSMTLPNGRSCGF